MCQVSWTQQFIVRNDKLSLFNYTVVVPLMHRYSARNILDGSFLDVFLLGFVIAEMTLKAREAEVSDDMLVYALMRGMCPELRAYDMGQESQLYCG